MDLEVDYRRRWDRFQSYVQMEYDTTRGDKTTDKWILLNKYSRLFQSPWYAAAWLRMKHDRFADIRFRYLVGPALGYRFFEKPVRNLSAELGAIYLDEDFYDHVDEDYWGPALFIDYDQYLWPDRVQFYHRSMGFAAVDGESKDLWLSWTGLRVPLVGGLIGSLEYEIDYDSEPAIEAKTTDATLRLKLGYEW